MNAYGYRQNTRAKRNTSALDTVLRFLRAVFEVIGERITVSGIRIAAVLTSFVISLGFVGGMESGSIPVYIGLPVCLIFAVAALMVHFDD